MEQRNKEKTWTYSCQIIFNGQKIKQLTITDYSEKHEKHGVSRQLIRKLVNELDGEETEPQKGYMGDKIPFVEEISYEGKKYRLTFWFKNGTASTNHLWIKNCYPCYKKKKRQQK